MKKGIAIILMLVCVFSLIGVSCTKTVTTDTNSPIATATPLTALPVPSTQADIEAKLMNNTWISPAKVEIGNYYPGARAEWTIRVHNSNEETTQIEKKIVGTEVGETSVDICLKYPLADNDITKVTVTSDNNKDSLIVASYTPTDKALNITGFAQDNSRIISIVYKAWTEFQIKYREPSYTYEDYSQAPPIAQDWIIITDSTLVFRPKETKEVLIALDTLKDTEIAPILTLYVSDLGKKYLVDSTGNATLEKEHKYQLLHKLNSLGGMTKNNIIRLGQSFYDNLWDNSISMEILINELLEESLLKWSDPNKWEFWTVYPEGGQGTLKQEMGTRWLVNMRP